MALKGILTFDLPHPVQRKWFAVDLSHGLQSEKQNKEKEKIKTSSKNF
jgi:hypothetical protein